MRKKRQKFISGLDIGTTKICAIIGQLDDDGQVTILGVGSHPSQGLKKGMVVDIEETVDTIQKAVNKAEQMADVEIREVFVGIAGGHITSQNSQRRGGSAEPGARRERAGPPARAGEGTQHHRAEGRGDHPRDSAGVCL